LAGLQPRAEQPAPRVGQRQRQDLLQQRRLAVAVADGTQQARQRPVRVWLRDTHDRVASLHPSRFQHAQVPARAQGALHSGGHVRHAETVVELPARLAALADLEQDTADLPPIADAHVGLVHPIDAEVLAEGARPIQPGRAGQHLAPMRIVRPGVAMHRLVRPAVDAPVALLVAGQPFGPRIDGARQRDLGDRAAAAGTGAGHRPARQHRAQPAHGLRQAHAEATARRSSTAGKSTGTAKATFT